MQILLEMHGRPPVTIVLQSDLTDYDYLNTLILQDSSVVFSVIVPTTKIYVNLKLSPPTSKEGNSQQNYQLLTKMSRCM